MDGSRRLDRVAMMLVIVAAALSAALAYVRFWPNADHLFWDMTHDRNPHYYQGLSMALNLRSGDIAGLARDVDSCRVWGILHPVMIATVELIGGPDVRLGVVPSVLGWFGAAVFAFLLARRACPEGGAWAGLLAATLVLASPAHRAFATDIMLESSGACLTLAVLYTYLVWVQEPSRRSAIGLAVVWSLLFFEKYNYWLLVTAAMTVNEMFRQPTLALAALRWGRERGLSGMIARLRHPLTILAILLAGAGFAIAATGGTTLSWRGRDISLRNPHNLVHVAYLLIFAQIVLWWTRSGKQAIAALPEEYRPLVYGHLVPILIWFTLPKRLFNFFWFLSPANSERPNPGFLPGLRPYWAAAQFDYHIDPAWLLVAVGLFVLAIISARGLRPGAAVILWLVAISTLLTAQHPMTKNRYIHSWIACLWVAAGIGLVQTLSVTLRRWPAVRFWSSGLATFAFIVCLIPAALDPGHAQEGGLRLDRPTTLALSRPYLPEIKSARHVAILCNVQSSFEFRWTYLEAFRRTRGLATDIKGYDAKNADANKILTDWIAADSTETVILIDVPKTSPLYTASVLEIDLQPIRLALEGQTALTLAQKWRLEHGETIELWSRTAALADNR